MRLNQTQVFCRSFPVATIRDVYQEELKIVCESPSYAIFNTEQLQHKPANVKVMPSLS